MGTIIKRRGNEKQHITYYINSNKTILYVYNSNSNTLKRYFSDRFPALNLEVEILKEDSAEDAELDVKTILNSENDVFKTVEPIASTVKPAAYFTESCEETGLSCNYLNEFLGSADFIESQTNNRFDTESTIDALKTHTPAFFLLLKNLFFNESDEVIQNFIRWLKNSAFRDEHQDIIWLFAATSEDKQAQGAGKGVMMDFLRQLMSGLVQSVSNEDYANSFNANLLNKKIIVFDEVDFKGLKYSVLKNITGSSYMRVEFKGKDPIQSKNVSSWMLFTNDYDLRDKITFSDRRVFLVRPNPTNGSLLRDVITPKFGDFDIFAAKLNKETSDIIHIISSCSARLKTPLQLTTQAKIDYFNEKGAISTFDLKETSRFFADEKLHKRILDVLKKNHLVTDDLKIKLLQSRVINFRLFRDFFLVLQQNGLANKSAKTLFEWERFKEKSLKNGYVASAIDYKATKKYCRYRDKMIISPAKMPRKALLANKKLFRELYGKSK